MCKMQLQAVHYPSNFYRANCSPSRNGPTANESALRIRKSHLSSPWNEDFYPSTTQGLPARLSVGEKDDKTQCQFGLSVFRSPADSLTFSGLNGCGSENRYKMACPGKWKHGLQKPAVCPSCLILSHTQMETSTTRSSSREVRIRVPLFSVVYLSRVPNPANQKRNGREGAPIAGAPRRNTKQVKGPWNRRPETRRNIPPRFETTRLARAKLPCDLFFFFLLREAPKWVVSLVV